MTDAEETSMSSVVAKVLLSESKELTVTSPDREAMVGVGAERLTSSVVVASLVSVGFKLSPLTIADKLSTTPEEVTILDISDVTLSTILISVPKIVELGIVSTSEVNGIAVTDVIVTISLSSG